MTEILPLVSIIVPVYNAEKYLKQCLDSLVSQTLQNIEIICVNDASLDDSLAILQEYESKDSRVIIINLNENLRQGGARNKGMEKARAKYIAFVDSDDWVTKDIYEKLYTSAEESKADIVNCDYYDFYSNNMRKYVKYDSSIFDMPRDIANKYFILSFPSPCHNLYKKTIFIENDIWFPEHTFWEDSAIMSLVFLLANKIIKVDEPLCYYRLNNNSTSHRKNDYRFFERLTGANLFLQNMKHYGFYEKYKEEIEYQFTNLTYSAIIWGCLNDFRPIEMRRLNIAKQEIKKNVPNFKSNVYFKSRKLNARNLVISGITINTQLGIFLYKIYNCVHFIIKGK